MRRAHHMPFGGEPCEEGGVRFRLWAPSARRVALRLEGAAPRPLTRGEDGWFEHLDRGAGPGTRYQYVVDDGLAVPDPASRFQPDGVHGPSEVIDPHAFEWPDDGWRGRPWHEAVIYELHVGAFAPCGSYAGVEARLDYLAALGVTAIELMPLAAFAGERGWGYDGVAPYAPCRSYGRPEALKALVAAAHARGLMVLLDVVYNHFGPEGCYLHAYASPFFTERHHTPWGAAIDLESEVVRQFFIHNALYWLEEYGLDGLRLDAVHAIRDDSETHLLHALAEAVQAGPGRERAVHLVLENDANEASLLAPAGGEPGRYRAQWNDDLHHVLHVLLTREHDGYYADYATRPVHRLGRCLAEGFDYQGERSPHRHGARRGEPSRHLPPTAFVGFLQNHDQVGNRALGERITALAPAEAVRAATAVTLLSPQVPLLFMGEEFATARPFPFFCDFGPDLAGAVTAGRRREFARFARFADEGARAEIPDPNDPATFASARLDWSWREGEAGAEHRAWHAHYRELLALRHDRLSARLAPPGAGEDGLAGIGFEVSAGGALRVEWQLADRSRLVLLAHLGPGSASLEGLGVPALAPLHAQPAGAAVAAAAGHLPAWSAVWYLEPPSAAPTARGGR